MSTQSNLLSPITKRLDIQFIIENAKDNLNKALLNSEDSETRKVLLKELDYLQKSLIPELTNLIDKVNFTYSNLVIPLSNISTLNTSTSNPINNSIYPETSSNSLNNSYINNPIYINDSTNTPITNSITPVAEILKEYSKLKDNKDYVSVIEKIKDLLFYLDAEEILFIFNELYAIIDPEFKFSLAKFKPKYSETDKLKEKESLEALSKIFASSKENLYKVLRNDFNEFSNISEIAPFVSIILKILFNYFGDLEIVATYLKNKTIKDLDAL